MKGDMEWLVDEGGNIIGILISLGKRQQTVSQSVPIGSYARRGKGSGWVENHGFQLFSLSVARDERSSADRLIPFVQL